jgi:hypothetical protein
MARRSAAQTEAASLREQLQARPNPEPNEPLQARPNPEPNEPRYDVVRTTRAAREP